MGAGQLLKDVWHREAETTTLRNNIKLRRWGMRVTVYNDGGNSGDYVLSYNLNSTDKQDNDNWLKVADIGATWGGGGGSGPGGDANEIQKNDGASGFAGAKVFSSVNGNITLGDSTVSGSRTIDVASSSTNAGIIFTPKGTGNVISTVSTGQIIHTSTGIILDLSGVNQIGSTGQMHIRASPGQAVLIQPDMAASGTGGSTSIYGGFGTGVAAGILWLSGGRGSSGGDGGDAFMEGGTVLSGAGNAGDVYIRGGANVGSGTEGNIALFTTSATFQSGEQIMFVGNRVAAPSGNPTNGFYMYSNSGVPTFRTSGGSVISLSSQPLTDGETVSDFNIFVAGTAQTFRIQAESGGANIIQLRNTDEFLDESMMEVAGSSIRIWYSGNPGTPEQLITVNGAGINFDSTRIGFFGATNQPKQVSGADLTNNVTNGGTDNVIDNWTDLSTYSNSAAAIRNAVYQLARKLKQVNDSLRVYGLLT